MMNGFAQKLKSSLRGVAARSVHVVFRAYWKLFRPVTQGARILLIDGGKVLLVQHHYTEHWYLPGGGVKRGESFEQAARREAMEEVGAQVKDIDLHGIYHSCNEGKSDHISIFSSSSFERTPTKDIEISRIQSFPMDHLPEKTSPATRRRIEEYVSGGKARVGAW